MKQKNIRLGRLLIDLYALNKIMDYSFNLYNKNSTAGLTLALNNILKDATYPPIFLCVGSDLTVGDSLGPLVGEKLTNIFAQGGVFVYGTLKKPITAKEIKYVANFLKSTHPNSPVVAIDAAVGNQGEIGTIKLSRSSLRPGSGANKKLGKVGDVSLIGIVAERSLFNSALFSATRLNAVNKMADVIADAVFSYLSNSNQISCGA